MAFRWENDELALFDEAISGGSDFCSSEVRVAGDHNHGSIVGGVVMVKNPPRGRFLAVDSELEEYDVAVAMDGNDDSNFIASIVLYSIMIFHRYLLDQ